MKKSDNTFIDEIIKRVEEIYISSFFSNTDNEHYKFIQSINKELEFNNYLINHVKIEKENMEHILKTILRPVYNNDYRVCDITTSGFSIENKDLLFEFKRKSNLLMGYKDLNYSFIEFKDSSTNIINIRPPKNFKNEKVYVLLEKVLNIRILSEFQEEQKIFKSHRENVELIFKEINKLPFNVVKSLENIELLKMTKEEIDIIRLEHDINISEVISSIQGKIFLDKNEIKNTI